MTQKPKVQSDYDILGEADLVDLAKAGHRDAFRAIMQRCNQRLFRVARGVVRNEAEAEDVVQEAYTRAFAKLHTFRGDAGILTWLTRITLNEAHGRLRARRVTVDLGLSADRWIRALEFKPGDRRVVRTRRDVTGRRSERPLT